MKNIVTRKTILKIVGLVIMSFWGFINCISLYRIGKKTNSSLLKIFSIALVVILVASCFLSTEAPISGIITIAAIIPTILTLVNIGKYKNACIISDLIDKYDVDVESIPTNPVQKLGRIKWASPALVKVANQMYPNKGNALIQTIHNNYEQKQREAVELEELARNQKEQERIIAEEKRMEEFRIQEHIEQEKRLAEEKRLEGIRIQEKLERDKLDMDTKFTETQKQHQVDIALIKADAIQQIENEKNAAQERERTLQEEIETLKRKSGLVEATTLTPDVSNGEKENLRVFCHQCGKPLVQGKLFCAFCGTKNDIEV